MYICMYTIGSMKYTNLQVCMIESKGYRFLYDILWTYMHTYMCIFENEYVYMYMITYICIYIYAHVCAYMCIYK
jgi:hypothetical protein